MAPPPHAARFRGPDGRRDACPTKPIPERLWGSRPGCQAPLPHANLPTLSTRLFIVGGALRGNSKFKIQN
jgi:hypothetical protein